MEAPAGPGSRVPCSCRMWRAFVRSCAGLALDMCLAPPDPFSLSRWCPCGCPWLDPPVSLGPLPCCHGSCPDGVSASVPAVAPMLASRLVCRRYPGLPAGVPAWPRRCPGLCPRLCPSCGGVDRIRRRAHLIAPILGSTRSVVPSLFICSRNRTWHEADFGHRNPIRRISWIPPTSASRPTSALENGASSSSKPCAPAFE